MYWDISCLLHLVVDTVPDGMILVIVLDWFITRFFSLELKKKKCWNSY